MNGFFLCALCAERYCFLSFFVCERIAGYKNDVVWNTSVERLVSIAKCGNYAREPAGRVLRNINCR